MGGDPAVAGTATAPPAGPPTPAPAAKPSASPGAVDSTPAQAANAAADDELQDQDEEGVDVPRPGTGGKARAKRASAAWATGGLSEVGRFAKKGRQGKG
jgi:hypothetical protein